MTTKDHSEMLSPAEIAAELKISPRYVRRWIRAGTLPAAKLGPRTQRVRRDDLEAFLVRFRLAGRGGAPDEKRGGPVPPPNAPLFSPFHNSTFQPDVTNT